MIGYQETCTAFANQSLGAQAASARMVAPCSGIACLAEGAFDYTIDARSHGWA
jgi:hypothetical protein